jgi:hypothetical protein
MATRSAAKQRKTQRLAHLAGGLLLIAYVYGPVGPQAETLVRLLVVPLLVLTGLLMWQAPRIRRLLKARRGGRNAPPGQGASVNTNHGEIPDPSHWPCLGRPEGFEGLISLRSLSSGQESGCSAP